MGLQVSMPVFLPVRSFFILVELNTNNAFADGQTGAPPSSIPHLLALMPYIRLWQILQVRAAHYNRHDLSR
jgi:hypothetical protein